MRKTWLFTCVPTCCYECCESRKKAWQGELWQAGSCMEMLKEGDAPVGSPAKVMLLHLLTAPANRTFSLLCSPLSVHPVDLGGISSCFVPGPSATEVSSPSCSDLAAQGSSSAELEEGGGEGGAKQQEAQIDLFLPPLL